MLTFNVIGVPGPPIPRLLGIFFFRVFFFNPTDRPNIWNAFDAKRKKKGMALEK